MPVRRFAFLFCLLAGLLAAQTKIDYNTQIKNAPQFFGTTYTPAPYTTMGDLLYNGSYPAPFQATLGTLASPTLSGTSPIFAQIVGSTLSDNGFGDPSSQPVAIKAYAVATGPGDKANVTAILGVAQTNGGCGGNGSAGCSDNSTGGIGVEGESKLSTSGAASWAGFFVAYDDGFNGSSSALEVDNATSAPNRQEGLEGGILAVDVDQTSGAQSVGADHGIETLGYGKGFVYNVGLNTAPSFTGFWVRSAFANSTNNAKTTILGFQSGQPGPFNVGIDFTNATFLDSAIKNASIKQPQILSGVSNGSGFEHFSACASACTVTLTPCTTTASAGATCTSTITLPVAMADNAYQASCSGQTIFSGAPTLYVSGKSATQLTVGTMAVTAAAAAFGEVDCHITHN